MKARKIMLLAALTLSLGMSAQVTSTSEKTYQKEAVKLGKKIARQMRQDNYQRTPGVVKEKTALGWSAGETTGNRRPFSFVGAMDGAVVGTMAHSYKYQNYYHGPQQFNYRKKLNASTDISALDIANITYADDSGDMTLTKDETAQIYFDLINTGDSALYGITPVLMAYKTEHVLISDPVCIDTLQGGCALRYVVELMGDGKRNPGKVNLLLRIKYGQQQYADIKEIELGGKK